MALSWPCHKCRFVWQIARGGLLAVQGRWDAAASAGARAAGSRGGGPSHSSRLGRTSRSGALGLGRRQWKRPWLAARCREAAGEASAAGGRAPGSSSGASQTRPGRRARGTPSSPPQPRGSSSLLLPPAGSLWPGHPEAVPSGTFPGWREG